MAPDQGDIARGAGCGTGGGGVAVPERDPAEGAVGASASEAVGTR
ncbi:MAG TPA: hypothetical protein VHQ47_13535 [Phycisphaerae bacterium]|nr:hypothetical protein [Phycisphaerae bacterium]